MVKFGNTCCCHRKPKWKASLVLDAGDVVLWLEGFTPLLINHLTLLYRPIRLDLKLAKRSLKTP